MSQDLAHRIVGLLKSARLDLSSEAFTQRDIGEMLVASGIEFIREYRLSRFDIIDFLIGTIGLEVKMRGANKVSAYHQLARYAKHDNVTHLILASNLSMGLPETIEGKDVYFVGIGGGWLG